MALPPYRIKHPLWMVFGNMMLRCGHFKGAPDRLLRRYKHRGIQVCPEWRTFPPFEKWALEHGYQKGLELDRIDNNGNYCPENCRFVTHQENTRNRERTIMVEVDGNPVPLITVYEESGTSLSYDCVCRRYKRGMPLSECLTRPNKLPNRRFLSEWNRHISGADDAKIKALFMYDTRFAEEHNTPPGKDPVFDALWLYAAREHYALREAGKKFSEIAGLIRSLRWVAGTEVPATREAAIMRHNAELAKLLEHTTGHKEVGECVDKTRQTLQHNKNAREKFK